MKTVEILAKYLPAWNPIFVRIVQGTDGCFYGVYAHDELAFAKLNDVCLCGIAKADDYRTSVNREEWIAERNKPEDLVVLADTKIKAGSIKAEDLESASTAEDRYQAKLHYLGELLVTIANKNGGVSQSTAEVVADAVSASFDRIKL